MVPRMMGRSKSSNTMQSATCRHENSMPLLNAAMGILPIMPVVACLRAKRAGSATFVTALALAATSWPCPVAFFENPVASESAKIMAVPANTATGNEKSVPIVRPIAATAARKQSMANILQAWGYNFIVLNGANTNGDADLDKFLENISELSNGRSSSTILSMDNFASLEDLFSYSDFQNLVLSKRGSSKEANSIYLKKKNLSRMLVAARFSKLVEEGKLQLKDFDEESRSNFKWLFNSLSRVLK